MTDTAMTRDEREAFLEDLHVGVMSVNHPGQPPLTIPIWYDYRPGGEIVILTSSTTIKGRLLEMAGGFSLCVQTESRPYSYVSVEGELTGVRPADKEADLRPMARRYLGETAGDAYTDNVEHGPNLMVYSMRPNRWYTVDYSKIQSAGASGGKTGT